MSDEQIRRMGRIAEQRGDGYVLLCCSIALGGMCTCPTLCRLRADIREELAKIYQQGGWQ